MCDNCGCNLTDANRHALGAEEHHTIEVLENLLQVNDVQAGHNREHFDEYGVFAVNIMSGPGSGKTSLLEATIKALPPGIKIAVIEGDLETENDAERIRRHGVPAIQITTGMACHLDAHMVHEALHELPLQGLDILFIENVGNLVCPASFDIGQHRNVILLSVTEGDDKPVKYPVMVHAADLALLTKTDLLPYIEEFSLERARDAFHTIKGKLPIIELSAKNGVGLQQWIDWLLVEVALRRQAAAA